MKRYISAIILICMLGTVLVGVIPSAAAEATLSTDKAVYEVGEPIMVSASSENSGKRDWVGILPKGGERWGSICWIYVSDIDGAVDITDFPNGTTNSYLAPYKNFPAGEYTLYLIPDDLSLNGNEDKALARVDIRIGSEEEFVPISVKAPTGATYTPHDPEGEYADGEVSVTLKSGHNAEDVCLWWGDDDGRLEGYGRISMHKIGSSWKTELSFEMREGVPVPKEATRLLIYGYNEVHGLSEDYFAVDLPESLEYNAPEGEPLMEFQIVSDIHISKELYSENFEDMLKDIVKNSPESIGIFAVGDVVDRGAEASQWSELWSVYDSVEGAPEMYIGLGNHESYGFSSYRQVLGTFLKNLRLPDGYPTPDTPYYDLWIGGIHFIFLGDTDLPVGSVNATIGNEQYAWLSEKLAENADGRPIFLFMHQPLRDTVSGSLADEGWWGIEDCDYLRVLLEEYPQIIMFNGHTHWTLEDENAMHVTEGGATIFNTASVGYLWNPYYKITGEYLDGSQGYYVEIYEDRVLVRGRDFVNGEWVPTAHFELTGVTIPDGVGGGEIKLPEEKPTSSPTERPTEAPTDTPTEEPSATAPVEEGGCGSSLGACGAILIVSILSAALTIFKRR